MTILKDSVHFDTLRSKIKFQQTPWDSLVRAGDISDTELQVLKSLFQHGLAGDTDADSDADSTRDLKTLFSIVQNTENTTVLQNCYSLLIDLFLVDGNAARFASNAQDAHNAARAVVASLAKVPDSAENADTVRCLALYSVVVLLLLLAKQHSAATPAFFEPFFTKVFVPLFKHTRDTNELQYVLVRYLQELAAVSSYRAAIYADDHEFVEQLFAIILRPIAEATSSGSGGSSAFQSKAQGVPTNNLSVQLQYYALLTVWLLTFDNTIAGKLSSKYASLLIKLLRLISVTIKEKITRLSVSILLNCARNNKNFCKKLVLLNNSKVLLANLSNRKFADLELTEDLRALNDLVAQTTDELNSFDQYLIELDSKQLCWSPPHIDTQFWYDNVDRFRDNNWKLLKALCDLITEFNQYSDSSDLNERSSLTLQVVLSDLTHIIEMLPDSVEYIEKFHAKIKIMELLNYPDSKVKYEALKTTQALVKNSFK